MQNVDLGGQNGVSRPASPAQGQQQTSDEFGPAMARRASNAAASVASFDARIKTADTAKLTKYLHRFNLLVGFCLLCVHTRNL